MRSASVHGPGMRSESGHVEQGLRELSARHREPERPLSTLTPSCCATCSTRDAFDPCARRKA